MILEQVEMIVINEALLICLDCIKRILLGALNWVKLDEAISSYSKLIKLRFGIKSLNFFILEKLCLKHVATLRRFLETHHSLRAYSKNTYLLCPNLSLNLT